MSVSRDVGVKWLMGNWERRLDTGGLAEDRERNDKTLGTSVWSL